MKSGIWGLLFKLLVLQYLMDVNGKMWLRNLCHLYVVEILEGHSPLPKTSSKRVRVPGHHSIILGGGAFVTFWRSPTSEAAECRVSKEKSVFKLTFLMSGVKILSC